MMGGVRAAHEMPCTRREKYSTLAAMHWRAAAGGSERGGLGGGGRWDETSALVPAIACVPVTSTSNKRVWAPIEWIEYICVVVSYVWLYTRFGVETDSWRLPCRCQAPCR